MNNYVFYIYIYIYFSTKLLLIVRSISLRLESKVKIYSDDFYENDFNRSMFVFWIKFCFRQQRYLNQN